MLGYGYCAMYRGNSLTEEMKRELEKKKEDFKKEWEERTKVIDFNTRKPVFKY